MNNIEIVLDVETTGLDYKKEKIIEFAAVKLVNDEVVDEYQVLIDPQQEIHPSSQKIHGITAEMLEGAPTMEEVMPKILEFMGDYPIVAHNVVFDYNFLNRACWELYDRGLNNQRIDSQHLFKEVFPEEYSHGLESLMRRFNVEIGVRHRAMADAMGLALAYPPLKKLYDEKYAWQISQLDKMNYLFERFLRIQQAVQTMQAEMQDIKSIFKIYFEKGGNDITATTGEILTYHHKKGYNYDINLIKDILSELGAFDRAVKVNNGLIDRMISGATVDDESKEKLAQGRIGLTETRNVQVIKPDRRSSDDDN